TDKLLELKPIELPNRSLRGWIGRPDFFRRTNDLVYCFLNGRPVKDKVILHAVREGYSDFQIPGRYPAAVLLLDLDPSEVDVNVHPTKREVRFRDSSSVHRLVYRGVKDTLVAAGSVPDLLPPQRAGGFSAPPERPAPSYPAIDRSAFGGEGRSGDPFGAPRGDGAEPSRVYDGESSPGPGSSAGTGSSAGVPWSGAEGEPGRTPVEALPSRPLPEARELVDGRELRVVQMHNAYVMIEEPDGLRVIDQHALHEKILYEELLEARERGVEKQPLLVPETVELTDKEWEVFSEAQQPLADLGFEIEPFGESTVAIQAVPNGFDGRSTPALLRAALAKLGDALDHGAATDVDLHESLIETMACKRAIKAGQKLTESQLLDLVRGRARAFQPQNCPHGRAAELFLSWEELDRRFDRK
ncbi:MAG: DNA mismatch repair endonuclease MutL, partial [Planctomycetota bacterium]